ncbi:MAG: glycosyltransferase family 2 protein [Flavobacteriaceae bacterium]
MLSICIPTYNTDCSELLDILAEQIAQLEETVEVLVCDDFSTDYVRKNQDACERNGFSFFENTSNLGSISTRIKLAKKSSFNWLLFIDADMVPKDNDFILLYVNFIKSDKGCTAIGGCCYSNEIKPFNLRLRYGRKREEIHAKIRQMNPYNSILFGNILIKKDLFGEVFNEFKDNKYGEDIYLSSFLKSLKKDVIHLPNEVYHLGLENNREFVKKIQKSGEMLARLDSLSTLDLSHIKLIKTYYFLRKYMLAKALKLTLAFTSPFLKTVLIAFGGPLLFIDLMRLSYFLKAK